MDYEFTRRPMRDQVVRNSGPYEAIIVNHFDPFYMGNLEVELLKHNGSGSVPERTGQLVVVRYLSPFYGVTPLKGITPNDGYEHSQKSYGMWAVPPDPGTRVLVVFAEGNTSYGYWVGCIQDQNMNFMVPDGRASTTLTTEGTPQSLRDKKVPVGEYNKLLENASRIDPTLFEKPYNKDFTEVLQVQGLINDEVRGTTTTSARREAPSMVFGISTPGPLDKRQNSPTYKYGETDSSADYPFNRLGGSSFVMDDGDARFVRATHAEEGPPVYINKGAGESGGDETIPQNELVRIRTRTGHQILLHNSEDLIYISNSRGTAWIELTSDGKIDIHSQDSISIMSNTDINFTAERDFNVDVGRNINMRASARWSDFKEFEDGAESGRVQIEAKHNINFDSEKATKISTADLNINNKTDFKLFVDGNFHLYTTGHMFQQSRGSTHFTTGQSFFHYIKSNHHLDIEGSSFITTYKDQHRKAGYSFGTANNIIVNPEPARIYDEALSEINQLVTPYCGDPWQANTRYEIDHTVSYGDKCYKCTEAHVSGTSFDASKWTETGHGAGSIKQTAGSIHRSADSSINDSAGGAINLLAGSVISGDSGEIHWNSGASDSAAPAGQAIMSATATKPVLSRRMGADAGTPGDVNHQPVRRLPTVTLPYVIPGVDQPIPYESILTRAPQHEPWPHHENMNPLGFKPQETDRENPGLLTTADRILTPDTFLKNMGGIRSSIRVAGSGGNIYSSMNPVNSDVGSGDYNQSDSSVIQPNGASPGVTPGDDTPQPPFAGTTNTAPTQSTGTGAATGTYTAVGQSSGAINYQNSGTRGLALEPKLEQLLRQTAEEVGVDVYITSGGQMPRAEILSRGGTRRGKIWYVNGRAVATGSVRHDYGSAADIKLKDNGQFIRIDSPVGLSFIRSFFKNGGRGGGFSQGYMGLYTVHLDIVGTDRGGSVYWSSTNSFISALQAGLAEQSAPIRSDYANRY